MITIIRPAYYAIDRVAEYCGLSTDDKSTIDAHNADEFYEIDTGTNYKYDAVSAAWIVQSVGGGGGNRGAVDKEHVDAIIPAYTTADNGKVLGVVEGKLAWVSKA